MRKIQQTLVLIWQSTSLISDKEFTFFTTFLLAS